MGVREAAARMLAGEQMLYGTAYRNDTRDLKHYVASGLGADLLVLGSSRSMQFRSQFFTEPSFYNAGGAAGYSNEYLYFLQNLPEDKLPKTLILQLDQYNYQMKWGVQRSDEESFGYGESDFKAGYAVRKAMTDWAQGKYKITDLLNPAQGAVGVAAAGRGSGFYNDGSYNYGRVNEFPAEGGDPGFSDTMRRIDFGINRFEWADKLYAPALTDLRVLLEWCSARQIRVVAILAPYAPSIVHKMEQSGNYTYMQRLSEVIAAMCEVYGFEFFDYTYMENTTDEEFIDGYHGSDRVYCKIALDLGENSAVLADYIDTQALQNMLDTQPGIRGFVF